MRIKQHAISVALIVITATAFTYFSSSSNKIWGAGDEPYMVIAGKKPSDAKISVQVQYFGRVENCSGWSWNAGSGKLNTGIYNENFKIEHNFSGDENHYELRIPFLPRQPEQGCTTELSDMEVKLTNEFDPAGFAQLRIYQAGNDYDNKPLNLNSSIRAKHCNAYIHQWKNGTWSGGLGCNFYVDDKKKSKEPEFNAEKVHFDFSQFTTDTVIHYDILAGDDYRSDPLDPKTGK